MLQECPSWCSAQRRLHVADVHGGAQVNRHASVDNSEVPETKDFKQNCETVVVAPWKPRVWFWYQCDHANTCLPDDCGLPEEAVVPRSLKHYWASAESKGRNT